MSSRLTICQVRVRMSRQPVYRGGHPGANNVLKDVKFRSIAEEAGEMHEGIRPLTWHL
jgi:hypothetical protein